MRLPRARGPLSAGLLHHLESADPAGLAPCLPGGESPATAGIGDAEDAGDGAIALWVLHELHHRGFEDLDERWEWAPSLMPLRARLEAELERRLRARWDAARKDSAVAEAVTRPNVADALQALIDEHEGPSLAQHLQHTATREQAEDLLRQRSLYHLKEADPTSWVIPRLTAGPKAALMQVQYDEYGAGAPERLHHELFARGLEASGLDAAYGAYVEEILPSVLEQNVALTMLGLHRRLRGAALGHLAAFEATSALPSKRVALGLRRVGLAEEMAAYYDEHVEADAVHEHLVLRDVCGRLVEEEPGQRDEVLLGAWTCLDLEVRTARELLGRWHRVAA